MPTDPNMAMRNFDYSGVVGINMYVTGVRAACIFIGAVEALQETPAVLRSLQLRVGGPAGQVLSVHTALQSSPPDYVECEDIANASSCRAFNANGFALPTVLDVSSAAAPGTNIGAGADLGIDVKFSLEGTARAEVTLVEKSTELLGPFRLRGSQ